jgi:hypothetical protein
MFTAFTARYKQSIQIKLRLIFVLNTAKFSLRIYNNKKIGPQDYEKKKHRNLWTFLWRPPQI